MSDQWAALATLAVPFLALFALAEWLHQKKDVQAESTRKLVHTGTGLLTMLFPIWLRAWWQAAVLCVAFFIVLIMSKKRGFLNSIHGVARQTAGSGLYPVIVLLVFAFYHYVSGQFISFHPYYYFYMPVLIMAFADPAAAVTGTLYARKQPHLSGKTRVGSVAFFCVAFVVGLLLMQFFGTNRLSLTAFLLAISIAFFTMLAEKYSRHGWDNFFIPTTAMGIQWLFEAGYR